MKFKTNQLEILSDFHIPYLSIKCIHWVAVCFFFFSVAARHGKAFTPTAAPCHFPFFVQQREKAKSSQSLHSLRTFFNLQHGFPMAVNAGWDRDEGFFGKETWCATSRWRGLCGFTSGLRMDVLRSHLQIRGKPHVDVGGTCCGENRTWRDVNLHPDLLCWGSITHPSVFGWWL